MRTARAVTLAAPYVGRFAPSPTGPLHFGSLLAATASYLQARRAGGAWLLRIEDIDPPRALAGAEAMILEALETYGFEWDGDVIYQSRNDARHRQAADDLVARGEAYRCGCSRRDLADAPSGPLGTIYPGTCRGGSTADEYAIRVRTHAREISFVDGLQGPYSQRLEPESGDFIIVRRDGLIAYHLAVVVDDAADGVTEIVRGYDLLDSTPRHIHLQQLLNLPTPRYLHIPVIENSDGQKLSKLTGAAALPLDDPRPVLLQALAALAQPVPTALRRATLGDIWAHATEHWDPDPLAGRRALPPIPDTTMAEPRNPLS